MMTGNHLNSTTGLAAMRSPSQSNSLPNASSSSISSSSASSLPVSTSPSSASLSQCPLQVLPPRFHFSPSKVMPGQFAKLKLENPTTSPIGYKFKTNSPMKYSVKPVIGVVPAGETIKISVRSESWISPQDRFLLQSVSLTKDEVEGLTSATWRTLDRTRLTECYIPCTSTSVLALKDPEDDLGSLSSSSASSTTTASSSYTPPFHALDWQPQQQQQQHHRHQQVFERWQYSESMRPTVSIGGLGRRPSSTSSTCSSAPSSPGSYPTLFLTSTSPSSIPQNPTSGHPPKLSLTPAAMPLGSSTTSKGLFIPSTIPEEGSSPTTRTPSRTMAIPAAGSKETIMLREPFLDHHGTTLQHLSRSKRIMNRVLIQLQGLRTYSRTQLLALALICIWIGIMFPFSRMSGLLSIPTGFHS